MTYRTSAGIPSPGDIDDLLLLVADRALGGKEQALERILSHDTVGLLPLLEAALRDGDNADRRNGAMEVYETLGEAAVPELCRHLADACEEVRNFSAVMLGNIGSRASVPSLVTALRDDDVNVRHAAAEALGKIGDRSALPSLLELLNGDFWVRFPAIVALGGMRDQRAVPHLLQLLDDEMLASAAVDALGAIGDPRALYPLGNILGYTDEAMAARVVRAMADIYGRVDDDHSYGSELLGDSHKISLQDIVNLKGLGRLRALCFAVDVPTRHAAVQLLGWIGETAAVDDFFRLAAVGEPLDPLEGAILSMGRKAVPAVAQGLQHPADEAKILAVRSLRWLEGFIAPSAVGDLLACSQEVRLETLAAMEGTTSADILPALLDVIEDGSDEERIAALAVLAHFPQEVTGPVACSLAVSPEAEKRRQAAMLLGMPQCTLQPDLLVRLLDDEAPAVRREGVKAAGTRRFRGGVKLLVRKLDDSDAEVREEAVRSLAEYREPSSLPALFRLLGAGDSMDYAVISAAGRIGSSAAATPLLDYLRKEGTPRRVEFAAIEALGRVGAREAQEIVAGYLSHPEADFRRTALASFSRTSDPHLLDMIAAASRDPHWSVRIAATEAAARVAGKEALPLVLERMQDDDVLVRRRAATIAGERKLHGAVQALVSLLADPDVAAAAFESLFKMGKPVLPGLYSAATGEVPVEVREQVVDIIGKLGQRSSVPLLVGLLDDAEPLIRTAAIDSLLRCFDTAPVKKLGFLMKDDPDAEVRSRARMAFKALTLDKFF